MFLFDFSGFHIPPRTLPFTRNQFKTPRKKGSVRGDPQSDNGCAPV
jgi:hypothetical protein